MVTVAYGPGGYTPEYLKCLPSVSILPCIQGDVLAKGTINYEKRRLIHNGLCKYIYPDWIVVPESTEDVAAIVQITNKHNAHISVRSGGHSFTCQSTKQGKIFFHY